MSAVHRNANLAVNVILLLVSKNYFPNIRIFLVFGCRSGSRFCCLEPHLIFWQIWTFLHCKKNPTRPNSVTEQAAAFKVTLSNEL